MPPQEKQKVKEDSDVESTQSPAIKDADGTVRKLLRPMLMRRLLPHPNQDKQNKEFALFFQELTNHLSF
jgi:hypothetical protein